MIVYQNAVVLSHTDKLNRMAHRQCYAKKRGAGMLHGWIVTSITVQPQASLNADDWPTCDFCDKAFVVTRRSS